MKCSGIRRLVTETSILLLCFIVSVVSNVSCAKKPMITKIVSARRQATVIPGTWLWDVESNELGGTSDNADLWWEHVTREERYLVPQNGARIAVVSGQRYEDIDLASLANLTLIEDRISGSDGNNLLRPGTLLALRTAEGNMVKLKVVRYYRLHNFEFDGAEVLPANWKDFVLTSPDIDNYHLELEWTLYRNAQQ